MSAESRRRGLARSGYPLLLRTRRYARTKFLGSHSSIFEFRLHCCCSMPFNPIQLLVA